MSASLATRPRAAAGPTRGIVPLLDAMRAELAAHPALLVAYAEDFSTHDVAAIGQAAVGDRFVWLVRECGTELFRIAAGYDPVAVTYWLVSDQRERRTGERATRAYRVQLVEIVDGVACGTLQAISHDEAARLAALPVARARVTPGTALVAPSGLAGVSADAMGRWEQRRRAPRVVHVSETWDREILVEWQDDGRRIIARLPWTDVVLA